MRIGPKRNPAQGPTRPLALILALAVAGCGPSPTANLSPTSEQDPDRYGRAVRQSEEKARKDQEAERRAFRGKGPSLPDL